MELAEIFNKLAEKEGFEHGEAQGDKSISEAEKALNISFPEEYKQFLRRFGYASWNGGRLYGISKNLRSNIVHKNKLIRETVFQPEEYRKLPEDAFLIEDYGDAFFMLFGNDSNRKGQVGLYLSEKSSWEEKNWASFKVFLEEYCL